VFVKLFDFFVGWLPILLTWPQAASVVDELSVMTYDVLLEDGCVSLSGADVLVAEQFRNDVDW
jgi:hypothetical protein